MEVTDLISLQNQASGHNFSSFESKADHTVVHRPSLAYHLFLSINAHSLHFVDGYFLAIRTKLSNCERHCRPKIFTMWPLRKTSANPALRNQRIQKQKIILKSCLPLFCKAYYVKKTTGPRMSEFFLYGLVKYGRRKSIQTFFFKINNNSNPFET